MIKGSGTSPPAVLLAWHISRSRIEHAETIFVDLAYPDDFFSLECRARKLYVLVREEDLKPDYISLNIWKYVSELGLSYVGRTHIAYEPIKVLLDAFYPLKLLAIEADTSLDPVDWLELLVNCFKESLKSKFRINYFLGCSKDEGQIQFTLKRACFVFIRTMFTSLVKAKGEKEARPVRQVKYFEMIAEWIELTCNTYTLHDLHLSVNPSSFKITKVLAIREILLEDHPQLLMI